MTKNKLCAYKEFNYNLVQVGKKRNKKNITKRLDDVKGSQQRKTYSSRQGTAQS